jgi:hypothetical protein
VCPERQAVIVGHLAVVEPGHVRHGVARADGDVDAAAPVERGRDGRERCRLDRTAGASCRSDEPAGQVDARGEGLRRRAV